jgi:mono/diheme cytochrome c family protein
MRQLSFFVGLSIALSLSVGCSDSSPSAGKDAAAPGGSGGAADASAGGNGGSVTGSGGSVGAGGSAGSAPDASADKGPGGAAGPDGAVADAPIDVSMYDGAGAASEAGGEAGGLTVPAARGQYLVKNVLGCVNCHTPQLAGGGGLDNSRFLAGNDCFAKDSSGGCLASANLTNDETGLKGLSDTQIKDAIRKGLDPDLGADGGVQYLFAQMPYYQFANLTDDDANAIVAYLRTVPAVVHESNNTGTFVTQPASPQWAPVAAAALPNATALDGGTASVANGKYLAALACATCHTPNTSATSPLQLDATKAFQGGKKYNTTIVGPDGGSATKEIQSTNLTPDSTGLKGWTAAQIVTAIKAGQDEAGRTICSPMRPLPGISAQDATDIANYLLGIPAVPNPSITETCE